MSDIDDLERLIRARRSVRGFRPDPVPDALILRAFMVAQWAPSNCNTQPWTTHIVSGAAAERMRSALHDAAASRQPPTPDQPLTGAYPDHYRVRQIDSAKALFGALGIAREDIEGRRRAGIANFRFFDAPHAAFIFMRRDFGVREAADVGMFAQTLMLALTALGIGSCAQGALSHYAAIVREQLGVGEDQQLLFGIAFGWEDEAHPASTARVGRATIEEATTFHD